MLKISIETNKHSKSKKSLMGVSRKDIPYKIEEEKYPSPKDKKRLSRSVQPEKREFRKFGKPPRRRLGELNPSTQHLSAWAEGEHGKEGSKTADKDSGESSHLNPSLPLNKLKKKIKENKSHNSLQSKVKKSEVMTKSVYSSSVQDESTSQMNFSLSNLNFSTLVRAYDEPPRSKFSSHDLNLRIQNDEKSVRMENEDGYETPHLGLQHNPSLENLRKNSEEIEEFQKEVGDKKIISPQKAPGAKRFDAVNLILNINNNTDKLVDETLALLSSSSSKSSISDESLEEVTMEKVMNVDNILKNRTSTYKEMLEEYKSRSSRVSNQQKFWKGNPFATFYENPDNKSNRPSEKSAYEDNEAVVIEGDASNSPDFSNQWIMPKKNIKYGKSSVGYKPFKPSRT